MQMANNRGDQEVDLRHIFDDAGGHVEIRGEEEDNRLSAEGDAQTSIPELVRWVSEHKVINIVQGGWSVGHRTVNHWQPTPLGDIPGPNTYFGYVAWKP
jgi:hypothetical protein